MLTIKKLFTHNSTAAYTFVFHTIVYHQNACISMAHMCVCGSLKYMWNYVYITNLYTNHNNKCQQIAIEIPQWQQITTSIPMNYKLYAVPVYRLSIHWTLIAPFLFSHSFLSHLPICDDVLAHANVACYGNLWNDQHTNYRQINWLNKESKLKSEREKKSERMRRRAFFQSILSNLYYYCDGTAKHQRCCQLPQAQIKLYTNRSIHHTIHLQLMRIDGV